MQADFAAGNRNAAGMFETKPVHNGFNRATRIELTGPHIPASHKNAVPPGKFGSSAVCTWV